MQILIQILLIVIALFMIMLVLVQRGRGGGLAGALGGMGGQSAFGTKAGDMFTRITMVTAAVWIVLCMYAVVYLNRQTSILPTSGLGVQAAPGGTSKPGAKSEKESGTKSEKESGTTPKGEKSSEGKPADTKPAETKPADTKAADSKPAESSTPAESAPKSKSE